MLSLGARVHAVPRLGPWARVCRRPRTDFGGGHDGNGKKGRKSGHNRKKFSAALDLGDYGSHGNGGGKSQQSGKGGQSSSSSPPLNQLFKPVAVLPNPDDMNLGEELSGKINKQALLRQLNKFYLRAEVKALSREHGLDDYLYHQAYVSFRKFCMDVDRLPTELYVKFSDVLRGAGHVDDVFPYFLQ